MHLIDYILLFIAGYFSQYLSLLQNKTNGVISEASFLAPDFKTPVYMLNNFDDGVMFFEDYDDSTPPPESKFVIPETCRSTRGLFQ